MDDNVKAPFRIKPEWVSAAVSVVGACCIGFLALATFMGKSDQTATQVSELRTEFRNTQLEFKSTIAQLMVKLEAMPGDQVRLQQLESRVRDQGGSIGGLDARLNLVERKTDVNGAAIEGIRGASNAKLR